MKVLFFILAVVPDLMVGSALSAAEECRDLSGKFETASSLHPNTIAMDLQMRSGFLFQFGNTGQFTGNQWTIEFEPAKGLAAPRVAEDGTRSAHAMDQQNVLRKVMDGVRVHFIVPHGMNAAGYELVIENRATSIAWGPVTTDEQGMAFVPMDEVEDGTNLKMKVIGFHPPEIR